MTNIISISINTETVNKMDVIAKREDISRSKLIQNIIIYFCDNDELIKKVLEDE